MVLGPVLRYVDERRATIWFETERPGRVEVLVGRGGDAPHGGDVDRPRPPLCAGAGRGPRRPRAEPRVPGPAQEVERVARGGLDLATEHDPHSRSQGGPSASRSAAAGARPPFDAASTSRRSAPTPSWPWPVGWRRTSTGGLARASCSCSVTRSTPTTRRTRSWPVSARPSWRRPPTGSRGAPTRSRTSRSTPGCTTRRGRRPPCAGCCRPSRPAMLLDDHDLRDDWNTSLSWRRWVDGAAVVAGPGRSAPTRRTGCTSTSAT